MIVVLAGVNGAGKSSVIGSYIRGAGGEYFNPDECTRSLLECGKASDLNEANGLAWKQGYDGLMAAIDNGTAFTFETTLGGQSITNKLKEAIDKGIQVRIVYVGLSAAELHIERVRARVDKGGHDIPEEKIRDRYRNSRLNLIGLIEHGVEEVVVWDNSKEMEESKPSAVKVFHFNKQGFVQAPTAECPEWAKAIALAAMKRFSGA